VSHTYRATHTAWLLRRIRQACPVLYHPGNTIDHLAQRRAMTLKAGQA
jgi:hypothetical protein